MATNGNQAIEVEARTRDEWRKWLKQNHRKVPNCWLIIYKKGSGVPSVLPAEATEEALCFGWIDSKPNKRDQKSYKLYFASRKAGSVWSRINKERIARLIKEGRMTEAGMDKIQEAKRDGSWTKLDAIEEMTMPGPLRSAFKNKKKALKNFKSFPSSVKKGIYHWIISAKSPETLKKRISETVSQAARNIRANQWR